MPRSPSLIAIAFLILPSPALAQSDDGIVIDPDSPAGKQYAIPLEEARSEGSGEPGGAPGGSPPRGNPASAGTDSASAPLFGEGITRAAADRRQGKAGSDGSGSAAPSPAISSAARTAADEGTAPLGLIALGLIALGVALGLVLRRRRLRSG